MIFLSDFTVKTWKESADPRPDRVGRGECETEAEGEEGEEEDGAVEVSRNQRLEMWSGWFGVQWDRIFVQTV